MSNFLSFSCSCWWFFKPCSIKEWSRAKGSRCILMPDTSLFFCYFDHLPNLNDSSSISVISELNKEFPAMWLVERFLIWHYVHRARWNTAVKRRACANEYIFWQPRANFPRKNLKENMGNNKCHAKFTKKIEKFTEICKRKRKQVKGKLKTFQTQCLLSYRYSVDLPFCFELYQKSL